MSVSIRLKVIGSVALLAGSLLASTARASDAIRVSFGDLDVSTHPGVTELYARVHSAATAICAQEQGSRSGAAPLDYDRCVRDTTAATVSSARIPRLTALHRTRTGTRAAY
jgi:UrcA family protein